MDDRSGSQAPSDDDATASEVEDVGREAPPGPGAGAMPVRVLVSPLAAADGSAAAGMVQPAAYTGVLYLQQRHQWPPTRQQSEDDDEDPRGCGRSGSTTCAAGSWCSPCKSPRSPTRLDSTRRRA